MNNEVRLLIDVGRTVEEVPVSEKLSCLLHTGFMSTNMTIRPVVHISTDLIITILYKYRETIIQ